MAAPRDQQEQQTTATAAATLRPAERALHAFIARSKGPQAADTWCAQRLEYKRRIAIVVNKGTRDLGDGGPVGRVKRRGEEMRLGEKTRC